MFTKILIANRGEIACRIISTAKRLGIKTVAVYSDADRQARHVMQADEAVFIGPASPKESYLVGEKIVDAAKQTNAQAIHPGYGFLSENSDFCQQCEDTGITFIGPPVSAINAMGSKSIAKSIMQKAGVPLVPGYHESDQTPSVLKQAAVDIGFPVLLKASAGGGGKGMRQVWNESEFDAALDAAKREAMNGFGDDTMLIEKYLTQPRHVEIQIFSDSEQNSVYLSERDCSVQRRHQKVIEEAPAPGLAEKLRVEMGEAAVKVAKSINYVGAGTVEFLLNDDNSFYFMEMNTRLQVEHPVTEMITGQDLVEWQLRVAAGEALPLTQNEITTTGHAFEARIYAEDPDNDFLPATGRLDFLRTPIASDRVRVDTGVTEGDSVSVYYDPMIAKLIVWGESREKALNQLSRSLHQYYIDGLPTNIEFLKRLAISQDFVNANLNTSYIENHTEELSVNVSPCPDKTLALAALYLVIEQRQQSRVNQPDQWSPWATPLHSSTPNSWRLNESATQTYQLENLGTIVDVSITDEAGENKYHVDINNKRFSATGVLSDRTLNAVIDNHQIHVTISHQGDNLTLFTDNGVFQLKEVRPDLGQASDHHSGHGLVAPMNGTVVKLIAGSNSQVKSGDPLLIMEAMKMEHTICANEDGKVVDFYYQAGELVDGGALLVDFQPLTEKEA